MQNYQLLCPFQSAPSFHYQYQLVVMWPQQLEWMYVELSGVDVATVNVKLAGSDAATVA